MHPLVREIRFLARRARALVLYRGLAWCACAILAAVFLAGWLDYWFRFTDQGLRWLISIAVTIVASWCLVRFVWPAIRLRRSDTYFAQVIEQRFPDLRDRLSSAVAFLDKGNPGKGNTDKGNVETSGEGQASFDPRLGSPRLREAVVQDATQAISRLNVVECLDTRATRRAFMAILGTTLIVLAICAVDVRSSLLAAHRLAMPWKQETWPRRNWLIFTKRPERIAVGEEFVAELKDQRGWLPSEVTMLYWFDGDRESEIRAHRMEYVGGKMVHRLPNVTRSFRYRAFGGDDEQMGWTQLRVVEAPRIVESTIRLQPPDYTGLPETSSDRALRGFEGTTVTFHGRTSKPVSSATLVFSSGNNSRRDTAVVTGNGTTFQLPSESGRPWPLQESGTYGWTLVDRDGVSQRSDPTSRVEVLKDGPPTVTFVKPPHESYTDQGVVQLEALVKDDLAVHRVSVYVNDEEQRIVDVSNPPAIDSQSWPPPGEQRSVRHSIELAQIQNLSPGDKVRIRMIAADFKPQDSIAAETTITIITPDELKAQVIDQQANLVERLQETLRLQQTITTQTTSMLRELDGEPDARNVNYELAQGLVLGQRRVREQLIGDTGAIALVDRALKDLSNNHIADTSLTEPLNEIHSELNRLANDVTPPIEGNLEQASRTLQLNSKSDASTRKSEWNVKSELTEPLSNASRGQGQVIETLEGIVDRLSHWSSYRTLAKDVEQIRGEEESFLRDVQSLTTAAREVGQLSAEERAVLKRLAGQQSELASRMDRLHQRLERMKQGLADTDPGAKATIHRGLQVMEDQSLGAQMREAAQQVSKNRVGSTIEATEQIIEDLQQLKNAFEGSEEGEGPAAARQQATRQLQTLIQAISALADEQQRVGELSEELARQIPAGGKLSDAQQTASAQLAQQQHGLAAKTTAVASEAEPFPALSLSLRAITGAMRRTAQRIEEGKFDDQTLQLQQSTVTRLRQLVEAFQNSDPKTPPPDDTTSKSGNSKPPTSPGSPFGLAELRILRDWQSDVNLGTEKIAQGLTDNQPPTTPQQQQISALADDQQTLSQMVQQLVERAARQERTQPNASDQSDPPVDPAEPRSDPPPSRPDTSKPKSGLDDQLFDELPQRESARSPATTPPQVPAGEDLGQPSRPASRMNEIGQQMQRVGALLRQHDVSQTTLATQQQIVAELSRMIDDLKRQNQSQSSQQQAGKNQSQPSSDKTQGTAEPNATNAASRTTPLKVGGQRGQWASDVWGTLPDHVQQRFNNLSDEQFLPEFEELIKQYYDRLSKRGKKE